jgi:hypothetical protein
VIRHTQIALKPNHVQHLVGSHFPTLLIRRIRATQVGSAPAEKIRAKEFHRGRLKPPS